MLRQQGVKIFTGRDVAPQEAFDASLENNLILLHNTFKPVRVYERADGKRYEGNACRGNINIIAAGSDSYCRWEDALSFIRMDVDMDELKRAAEESGMNPQNLEIVLRSQVRDERVESLLRWLAEETENASAVNMLYTDTLTNMLLVHLLHRHSNKGDKDRQDKNDLTRKNADAGVARAIEYMYANLGRNFTLEELAGAVAVSQSHLLRIFKAAEGISPHQYLINLRVMRGKELLLSSEKSVSEVAAELGFNDQSHFSRCCKRILGVTPGVIRRSK